MAPRDAEKIVRIACPELDLAWILFDHGNFNATKKAVKATITACPEDRGAEVQAAAQQLLMCMAPDPWARRMAVAAFVVLVVLVINYVA